MQAKPVLNKQQILTHPALYTDFYELTMAQGYFLAGRADEKSCFDYFFRSLPFDGGYVIFAGLSDLLYSLQGFQFHEDEIKYLREQGFHPEFLRYLQNFKLSVNIHSMKEGEVVFPNETVLRAEGNIIETQLLETLILNTLNFSSLIATKASRLKYAAGERKVLDFGLRRAQGLGGIHASKAAIIGGVEATSNTYSAHRFELPASGTMAHSWIQSFDDELSAFRTYAQYYPDNTILLVDTYDTLQIGVPNAITVAKELEEKGHQLKGIRLDSGDLAYFARKARKQLDDAGLDYVKIAASNQLDERLIKSLIGQDAPIDVFGVGTRLVTGQDTPALDGVYKLTQVNNEPTLKISENIEKITLPGKKDVIRLIGSDGTFYGDGVILSEEKTPDTLYHPHYPAKHVSIEQFDKQSLLRPVMQNGSIAIDIPTALESAEFAEERLQKLRPEHKRFDNPHIYKVGISEKLMKTRDELTAKLKKQTR